MTLAVRKLSYAFHDDDSQMTMKEVIGIPGDEAELQRIRGYDIMVTKFLLFKHAWKILRQLYMAASAKKMLMTMGALGTSKSLSKFLILLRSRTEFTKKNILGKCIGESKCLRRSWNNFHRKIESQNREITINSIINKMVKKHYFKTKCSKFFRNQRITSYFKGATANATLYLDLRRLEKAMLKFKAHTWCHSKSSTGDRVGESSQLKRAKILRDNYMLQNFLLSWKASAHHGRLTAIIEKNSHYHCCRQRLVRGIRHLRMLTVRAQLLKLQLETFQKTIIRDMLLRRALGCMRSRVEIYCLKKDEEDCAGQKHLRYIASRALCVWSVSQRNRSIDIDRIAMSHYYVRTRSKKNLLTRWLDLRREQSSYRALTLFAADHQKIRMLSKFFVKWRGIRNFNILVTVVSNTQGAELGKKMSESTYRKHLRNSEYEEDSQQMRIIPHDAMLLFKYWSMFCSALRVRKSYALKLSAAHNYRLRSLLKTSFGAFLAIHQEHLSTLKKAERHLTLRSEYNALHRLECFALQAHESREKRSNLAMRITDLKLRRAFHCLLALTTRTNRFEDEDSSGVLSAVSSAEHPMSTSHVLSLPVVSSTDRIVKPSEAESHSVIRLGAKSSSFWISSQVHGACTEKRTVYLLKIAIRAFRRFKDIGQSYSAVRLMRRKRYATILIRHWRDIKAARCLLDACYNAVTTNTLQYYFSQWVVDEKIGSLLWRLSAKKEREKVSQHFRLWVAYTSKTRMDRIVFRPRFGAYEGKVLLTQHFCRFVTQLRQWGPVSRRAEAALTVGNREMMRKVIRKWRLQTQRPVPGCEIEGRRRGNGNRGSGARKLKKSWETAAARRVRGVLVAQCRGKYLKSWVMSCFLEYIQDRAQLHRSKRALDSYHCERLSRGVFTVLRCALRRRHRSEKITAVYEKTCRACALSRAVFNMDRYCVTRWVSSQKIRRAVLLSRILILKRGFRKLLLCTKRKRRFLSSTV